MRRLKEHAAGPLCCLRVQVFQTRCDYATPLLSAELCDSHNCIFVESPGLVSFVESLPLYARIASAGEEDRWIERQET